MERSCYVLSEAGVRRPDEPSVVLREGFDDFYRREYNQLVAVGFALTGSWWVAEDLAQEALLATYKRWDHLGGYDRPGAWARRVVVNRSVSRFRKARSEAEMLLRLRSRLRPPDFDDPDDAFWALVRSLPKRQAQVVALYYVDDLAVDDIATILRCAPGTVKAHLHAARTTLAARLEEES